MLKNVKQFSTTKQTAILIMAKWIRGRYGD